MRGVPDLSPPPLLWSKQVVRHARAFFGVVNPERRQPYLDAVGRKDSPEGPLRPFATFEFMRWLGHIGIEHTERRANDINALLDRMVAANLILPAGHTGELFGQTYWGGATLTMRQAGDNGSLWMVPVLGPELTIEAYAPSVALLTGQKSGDVHNGSGLLIDARHVLTAAHVLTDMTLDPVVHFDGGVTAPVIAEHSHPNIDVAIVEVDLPAEHDVHRTRGLAFRDPQWADQVTLLGYPPVPQADAPYLTVQTGEVVTPSVTNYFGTEHFLFSATARPGNSGGPVVAADGRVLGIVTRGFMTESSEEDGAAGLKSPFFAGITTSAIIDAFEELDTCRGLVPVEDWT
jgi:S1-C subfamily serine protease